MAEAIKNRYEFVALFDVENGNPNGDPDAGNMPRIDPESGLGLVTDVCLKRKIRNYIDLVKEGEPGYQIYIREDVPLNRSDRTACESMGITETDEKKVTEELKKLKKNDPDADVKIRDYMCSNFFDIRTFGAVMTTFVKAALNCDRCVVRYSLDLRGALIRLSVRKLLSPELPSRPKKMQKARIQKWDGRILFRMRFTG